MFGFFFLSTNLISETDCLFFKVLKKFATEKKARSVGFQNVIAAEGNVLNLKELILQNLNQKGEKLIYVSGETISVDLDQQLLKEGYDIKKIINYRTNHNEKFNENFIEALKSNMPDMVYVYSRPHM